MKEEPARSNFFISYVEADREWAEWIAYESEQAGYSVILRAWDFHPGDNEIQRVDEAIKQSHRVILVLSPEYFAAKETLSHWTAAFAQGIILPILVRACEAHLSGLLGPHLPIDLTGYHPEKRAQEILLAGLSRERARPPTTPIFPSVLSHHPDFPLPVIWNVPHQRNPFFLGRQDVLHSLRQALVPGAKPTFLTQAITGLGGIGKTQVAVEYAHQYAENYQAVLWLPADSWETLTSACLKVATEVLGLPEEQEAEKQVEAVKRWLQTHPNWLLILDNVEQPQEVLSTFLPTRHQGSVLLTTRLRDVGHLAHSEVLPVLPEEEAILLLLRRAKRLAVDASLEEATSEDVALARELCELLGRLPLALDQAGAYIAENGGSLQRYLDLYESFRPKLLDRRGVGDHSDSVFMTFWLSWDQIQQRNPLAGKALTFCAFLAPDQIPEGLVQGGIHLSEPEEGPDELDLDEAIGLLHRYSLVERTEQMLSLHRLVQEVTQEVLSEEERQQWMERAVLLVNAVFPSGEHGTWPLCEFLLPHALVCAKWASHLKENILEGARLLSATGRYLHERGLYQQAEPLLKCALGIYEERLGDSHSDTAVGLNNLALLYQDQGRYDEAEPLYERALQIREERLGASHLQTIVSLNNLAGLYRVQGRYDEAEPLYVRALKIREEQLGDVHPDTAVSLSNLALLYQDQGRYDEAEPLYVRALKIREERLGDAHPDTANSLNNLAALYQNKGRYDEAEPLYVRALKIREGQLGASHPSTATSLNNLAGLYYLRGFYEKAELLYVRVLEIREEQLGASHPSTATSLNNLAFLYYQRGHYNKAEPLYVRALKIREGQLGASHPLIASSLNNLAELYRSQGNYAEVEPLLVRALKIREEQLGASHPSTATSLNNLALFYQDQGRHAEAEPLLKRAVTITTTSLGMEHPLRQQFHMNYSKLLSHLYPGRDLQSLF